MRALLWVVSVLIAVWCGYWFVGSAALDRGVRGWLAAQTGQGYVAQASDIGVAGFPNRFDLTLTDPAFGDPAAGVGWTAPFVQMLSLSYKPWHVILALPNSQTFSLPQEEIMLTSAKMQASVEVLPNTELPLERAILVGADVKAASSLGWTFAATEISLASQRDAADPLTHRIGLKIAGVTPDPVLQAALQGAGGLPDRIDVLRLDADATLSEPINRFAQQSRPQLTGVQVKEAFLQWGDLILFAEGQVAADADGRASGGLSVQVENWRRLVPLMVASGVIAPEAAQTVTGMLETLAQDPAVLTIPLTFANGFMSLGPLPLGPAPRLH